jgi:oxygen-independent coproporphyrinogen-3 oxidase
LEKVVDLIPPPEHISAYSLIIEEGTPFYEAYERDELNLPDEETDRSMYEYTRTFLQQKGYERYEISNYAKKGFECRHNIGYWERKNYVGFGIGAASLVENVRFRNEDSLNRYIHNPCESVTDVEVLSVEEQMAEMMFLGLRMEKGVSFQRFQEVFGVGLMKVYGKVIEKHVQEGLLQIKKDQVFLTLKGMDVSNYVMADFLEP